MQYDTEPLTRIFKAIEGLEENNKQLREALKTLLDLLEQNEPDWYLRKHYNIAVGALGLPRGGGEPE